MARAGFYVGTVLLAVAVWQFQRYMYTRSVSFIYPSLDALNPLQEKQLEAFLEMNRLLTTLGTTLLGAIGFLMAGRRTRVSSELWTALASAVCVGLSVYFGYLAYQGILWMLQNAFFDLSNPQVSWTLHAHFYTFLLGVLLFADFALHSLGTEDGHEG